MKQNHEATIEQMLKNIPIAVKAAFVASYVKGLVGETDTVDARGTNLARQFPQTNPKASRGKTSRKRTRGPTVSGAEAQTKVLAVLNGNSGDKFQMSQIAKTSGLKPTTTQAALRFLIGEGKIFSSGERGSTRYSATKAGLKAETKTPVKAAKKSAKKATKKVNARHANGVAATA